MLLLSLALAEEPGACFTELATALSTDAMEGRGVGTKGLEKAADLLASRFRAAGLGDLGVGYRQPFEATTGVVLGKGNRLGDLVLERDFVPFGFSSSGPLQGPVVFAGYGIRAKDLGYDDYEGLDVKGKVVLVMRYEPRESDPDSPFDGDKPSRWSDLREKAMRAREAGAKGLVVVAPAREADEPDKLPPLKVAGPTSEAGIPVVAVTREVADRWLAAAGTTLAELHAGIDADLAPRSRPLPGVSLVGQVALERARAQVNNVVGVLPGKGALADEVVVVGAHYDHLGHGGAGSMRPDANAIHNGADDNASGTAAMVCAVERLAASAPEGERRTLVALAFAAEEIGLGGSGYYVDHPLRPLDRTVAMINLDMVGRVRDGKLAALGGETAPEWEGLLRPVAAGVGLELALTGDGYGPSDHTSFYQEKIPVLHLFSGSHNEYHTPDDDASTLNMEGGGQVSALLEGTVRALLTAEKGPTYVASTSGPRMAGDSRGYGAYLGSVPDYTAMESTSGGVLLGDVRAGSPAEAGGLKGGDRIVAMAGVEIQNLYDMTFVLRDHRPGETITIVVVRGEERVEKVVTLGQRGAAAPAPPPANPTTHGDFSVGAGHPTPGEWQPGAGRAVPDRLLPEETHLRNLRQLTFGGENAEAYWTPDGRHLVFQRSPEVGTTCDQQYVMDLTTGAVTLLSSGKGRTTCGYASWLDEHFVYATTEGAGEACPPIPDRSEGYVWPLYPSFDIVKHELGADPVPWVATDAYDAEATVCQRDGRVVYTSTLSGDLELWLTDPDGGEREQLTRTLGYDGGAFFTHDCSALVFRASRPTGKDKKDYKRLLKKDLVRPSALEIMWMDLATRKVTPLTANGAANFAPYPTPDDQGVIFSSNLGGDGREFDLFLVAKGGGEPARITTAPGFDGFPMFSPDGRWLVFASNRATAEGSHDTNLFVAEWVP